MKIGYLMQAGVPDIRSDPPSGPAIHVKRVIEELGKLGHHVRLLAAFDRRLWKSDNVVDFVQVTVPADKGILRLLESGVRRIQHDLKLPYAALFESLRFAMACNQELRDYDLLYERMGWLGYGGGLAARWLHIPLVLEVNGDHIDEFTSEGLMMNKGQQRLSNTLMKKAATLTSHVVATGEGWRSKYIERWHIVPSKASVIENGSALVDILQREDIRSFSPHKQEEPTLIAYSGGFDPWQGVTILIRAISRVIANRIPVRLLLIGSGVGVQDARQLVQELRLESHVVFTGQLAPQKYASCLAHADIGVSPYCGRNEYSGLKLMDYKAAGLGIIASGQDGQPAVLDHGRTGWIVPPCDEDALFQAIVCLSTDRELVRRMGRESRVEAERLHSWRNTAQELNTIFEQVIREYHGR